MLFLLGSALVLGARALNVTIDDTDAGAWTYLPAEAWGGLSATNACTDCQSQPDPLKTFDGTWHDCSEDGSATLNFTGTAVTIYTICPGPHENDVYRGHFAFELDGADKGRFFEQEGGCSENTYNHSIFHMSGLDLRQHSLQITNLAGTARTSNLLLDYAVIDDGVPDPNPTPSSAPAKKASVPVAAIVVPVLIVLAVLGAGLFFFLRRRRQLARERAVNTEPSPFKPPSLTSSIPMTAFVLPGHSSRGQSVDSGSSVAQSPRRYDPELEAALQIVAARSRSNASATTPSLHAINPPSDRKRRPQDDPFASPPAYGYQ
ncbi:hypothetical protein AURDEDRAFT_185238 [Auricularia subglabra TFB-10046 SS5]|nr:hypothetical protein AURDEDRAFT_185238 [Auricularia subglabra TFB-10046 SS5]